MVGGVKTPKMFDSLIFREVERVNYNTVLIKCDTEKPVALQVGQHIKIQATVKGKLVSRPYTPISEVSDYKHMDLLIKVYSDGVMTPYLGSVRPGDSIKYAFAKNQFALEKSVTNVGMICGGTGITPMINVARALLPLKVQCSLLFSNVIEEDILCKKMLDEWATNYKDIFTVHYTLTGQIRDDWKGLVGRPNPEMIARVLPPPSPSTKILVCGPVRMTNSIASVLYDMGYTVSMVFAFA